MKSLLLLVILAVASTSSLCHHNHHYDSSEEDDFVPSWWYPKPGTGSGRGFDNSGNKDPFDPSGRRNPWEKQTTTGRSRVTYPIYPPTSTTTTERFTTSESISESRSSTARSDNLVTESCIAACQSTPEHNPVCGTDNITYPNIGKLECARMCGVDVQLKSKRPCSSIAPTTPNPDNGMTDIGVLIVACIRNCPVTSEYNPVCGTDNVTYVNPGRLECARNCGVAVSLHRSTSCFAPVGPSDATLACMQTCSVTSEYNPVCGSDNVTYPNPGRLECAINCGLEIQLSRRSSCSVPPGPNNPDLRGSTHRPNGNGNGNGKPNGNGNWNGNGNKPNGNGNWNGNGKPNGNGNWNGNGKPNGNGNWNGNGKPNGNGNWNGNGSPNGNGNWNGNSNPNGNGNWNGNSNDNGNGNTNGIGNKTPTMTEVIACMQLCPITSEINLVCGTDGVTYSNPGKLLCTQFCGIDVRVRKFAPCSGNQIPDPNIFVCPTVPTTEVTSLPITQDCINKCVMTQSLEFKPVCGTNGVTYTNIESLQCKKNCGLDVSVRKLAPCGPISTGTPTAQTPPVWGNTDPTRPTVTQTPSSDMQTCINGCSTLQDYAPVCGTNGLTYPNIQRLQCAKQCGINVSLRSVSACSTIDESKDSTTEKYDIGFTIPADILASVFFPENNVPTQPTTSDTDESYELDIKFGETKN